MRELSGMGIKTIVSFRHRTTVMDEERNLAQALGIRWINIPMYYFWRPSDAQIRQFLVITGDSANRPIYLHCRQGKNRAGIMIAIYRMVYQGWSAEDAYAEARRLGLSKWNPLTRDVLFNQVNRKFRIGNGS